MLGRCELPILVRNLVGDVVRRSVGAQGTDLHQRLGRLLALPAPGIPAIGLAGTSATGQARSTGCPATLRLLRCTPARQPGTIPPKLTGSRAERAALMPGPVRFA